ncbi:cell division protein FtsQ/DivIB [Dokdonia sp. Hel_I_53]|uniref:cell division protein FtsQ/DivIB n=1 Tax=Dokdonia sp. Hel_I_53 TaxID=1566287 RepID=UPI00119C6D6F|nr:hypothetical protein [Dokdonia sp. Hel_I_53]TVZ51992.1 cell division protein FtsQ [Dokdonia sp. Hel_I_53]
MLILLGFTIFLVVFTVRRNEQREVQDVTIAFSDESAPFVTRETVNKLLIVSSKNGASNAKENLALSTLEKRITAHPIIKSADVYVTMSGKIGVSIEQRKPIARINGNPPFYMDSSGELMPLSKNFSAHVPLVSGTSKKDTLQVYKLATYIRNDAFLLKHIIGITRDKKGEYILEARKQEYKIVLGAIKDLNKRFSNYKAFYQKALKDKSLNNYKLISLKYDGQVVCEKK